MVLLCIFLITISPFTHILLVSLLERLLQINTNTHTNSSINLVVDEHQDSSLKSRRNSAKIKTHHKVLDVELYNVKALYRRAQAYMETADLQLAELDIKKALDADPQNREVKLIQKDLKRLQAESNKRDAKFYTNMFAGMAKDSSVAAKRLKLEKVEDNHKDETVMAMEMEKVAVTSAPRDSEMVVDSCGGTSVRNFVR